MQMQGSATAPPSQRLTEPALGRCGLLLFAWVKEAMGAGPAAQSLRVFPPRQLSSQKAGIGPWAGANQPRHLPAGLARQSSTADDRDGTRGAFFQLSLGSQGASSKATSHQLCKDIKCLLAHAEEAKPRPAAVLQNQPFLPSRGEADS